MNGLKTAQIRVYAQEDILRLEISVDDRAVGMKEVKSDKNLFCNDFYQRHGKTLRFVKSNDGEEIATKDFEHHTDVYKEHEGQKMLREEDAKNRKQISLNSGLKGNVRTPLGPWCSKESMR